MIVHGRYYCTLLPVPTLHLLESQQRVRHVQSCAAKDHMRNPPKGGFGRDTVLAAIEAVKEGKIVCVTDDESRENEGDLIMAAEFATPETIGFFVRYTSGVICVSVPQHAIFISCSFICVMAILF